MELPSRIGFGSLQGTSCRMEKSYSLWAVSAEHNHMTVLLKTLHSTPRWVEKTLNSSSIQQENCES